MTDRKYLAFDLEIAKEIPEGGDWRANSPLGISCAATLASDTSELVTWHGETPNSDPSGRMSREEVGTMVKALMAMVDAGYTLVTWNGLAFDFPVLAEESGLDSECQGLAANHVDMMFHLFCVKGYRLSLNAAAKGMGLAGKTPGMTGADAPKLWAEGKYRQVLDYLAQDVRTTLDLTLVCEQRRALLWTSQRGNPMELGLPRGWLTVQGAVKLPEPDTSWMTNPPRRGEFTAWLSDF